MTDGRDLELLVERYGLRLLGLAVSQLGDRETAEEIVQDALYHAHRQLVRGRPVTWAWLARAVVWRTRRARRSAWRRREVSLAEVPPGHDAVDPTQDNVFDAVRALPAALAEPTLLHYWAGFTVEETAHILRIPAGTVKSRLYRARGALGLQLAEDRSEDPAAAGARNVPSPSRPAAPTKKDGAL